MKLTDFLNVVSRVSDHAQNPRNHGPLEEFKGHARITGPCGDTMELWISAMDDIIEWIGFATTGCGTSHAAGSMTACLARGRSVREAIDIRQKDILEALGGLREESEHCALLASNTLKAACEDYMRHYEKEMS
jgi:nitrogen fixation protein NifU and related proteins